VVILKSCCLFLGEITSPTRYFKQFTVDWHVVPNNLKYSTPGGDSLKPKSTSSSHLDPGSNPGTPVDSDGVSVLNLGLKKLIIKT
jgi:hypothetical protein